MKKRWKSMLLLFIGSIVLLIAVCNLIVIMHASGRIYDKAADVPGGRYALVLGTSPQSRYTDGPNSFFYHRIDAAVELYKAGKIDTLYVSGSEHSLYGANEPECMSTELQKRGVPASIIKKDGKGTNTEASIENAIRDCGKDGCIVVSQEFHNQRALFLADHYGMNHALAFNAQKSTSKYAYITYARELLAKVKVFKCLF